MAASLEDIMLALGRVQSGVEQLREDFQEEKSDARESRRSLHARLDEHADRIAGIREDIGISGQITAQVRSEVKALAETVDANREAVTPTIEEWKRMKTLGQGVAWLLAIGGLSVGAFIVWAGETTAAAIRSWLRIP